MTIVSGDVHVGALGLIESTREGTAQTIPQLISSGIVHPPAAAIVVYALDKLFAAGGVIDRGIELSMQPLPGSKRRLLAARNWLSPRARPRMGDQPQALVGQLARGARDGAVHEGDPPAVTIG